MVDALATPGIDVRWLRVGTVIFVETESYLYELTVTHPGHGLVTVNSSDPVLREAPLGQLVQSWVGKGLVMEIRFSNGTYQSPAVSSVAIKGRREDGTPWSYDVC